MYTNDKLYIYIYIYYPKDLVIGVEGNWIVLE